MTTIKLYIMDPCVDLYAPMASMLYVIWKRIPLVYTAIINS